MILRGRREREIRERGRPAVGEVRSVRRARGRWIVGVSVAPDEGEPFEAQLRIEGLSGPGPRVGDHVSVLHSRGNATPMDTPVVFTTPPPSPRDAAREPGRPPQPVPHDVIGQVLRRLADGSLLRDGPRIIVDEPPGAADHAGDAPRGDAGRARAPGIDELVARASRDPAGVGDELLRRIVAGETTVTRVLDAARAAGPAGTAGIRAVLTSLHARGLIGDGTLRMLTRMAG